MPNEYTNKRLAQDYIMVVSQLCGDQPLRNYLSIKKKIENLEIDMAETFRKDGTLSNLSLQGSGIGSKTLETLGIILRNGAEKAAESVYEKRLKRMQKSQFDSIPRCKKLGRGHDGNPSFDNAARIYEDGI